MLRSELKFDRGDVVQCEWHSMKYPAKVVQEDKSSREVSYLVHYVGWNDRWNEWVTESRLSPSSKSRKRASGSNSRMTRKKVNTVTVPVKLPARDSRSLKDKDAAGGEQTFSRRHTVQKVVDGKEVFYISSDGCKLKSHSAMKAYCKEMGIIYDSVHYSFKRPPIPVNIIDSVEPAVTQEAALVKKYETVKQKHILDKDPIQPVISQTKSSANTESEHYVNWSPFKVKDNVERKEQNELDTDSLTETEDDILVDGIDHVRQVDNPIIEEKEERVYEKFEPLLVENVSSSESEISTGNEVVDLSDHHEPPLLESTDQNEINVETIPDDEDVEGDVLVREFVEVQALEEEATPSKLYRLLDNREIVTDTCNNELQESLNQISNSSLVNFQQRLELETQAGSGNSHMSSHGDATIHIYNPETQHQVATSVPRGITVTARSPSPREPYRVTLKLKFPTESNPFHLKSLPIYSKSRPHSQTYIEASEMVQTKHQVIKHKCDANTKARTPHATSHGSSRVVSDHSYGKTIPAQSASNVVEDPVAETVVVPEICEQEEVKTTSSVPFYGQLMDWSKSNRILQVPSSLHESPFLSGNADQSTSSNSAMLANCMDDKYDTNSFNECLVESLDVNFGDSPLVGDDVVVHCTGDTSPTGLVSIMSHGRAPMLSEKLPTNILEGMDDSDFGFDSSSNIL